MVRNPKSPALHRIQTRSPRPHAFLLPHLRIPGHQNILHPSLVRWCVPPYFPSPFPHLTPLFPSSLVDTNIVPIPAKLFLAGIPLTPVPRIAGAIFFSATDPSPASNGSAWLLPDNGPVFHVPREEFKMGVYKMIDDRANSLITCVCVSGSSVDERLMSCFVLVEASGGLRITLAWPAICGEYWACRCLSFGWGSLWLVGHG